SKESDSKTASRSLKCRLTTPPDQPRHPISHLALRKLRWAGMDDEAERLLKELKPLPTEEKAESVLPTRVETD
ncbi:MAG: hypothetical protein KGK33_06810, partial [Hyphomicrobiales bacterium]|nr:hypothetical protein [Hyphomicrobiales bacterium]